MNNFSIEEYPDLRDPIGLVAFTGWNDAANSASNAAHFITKSLHARRFASLVEEPFYDFTKTAPEVTVSPVGERNLSWPSPEFFFVHQTELERDLVIAIAAEPDFRWRTFSQSYVEMFESLNVSLVISMGALLAESSHRRPIHVVGSSADPDIEQRLQFRRSSYEGPTGILGVLNSALQQADVPAISLWASVPHYITETCPPATLALLEKLESIADVHLDTNEISSACDQFYESTDATLNADPTLREYVRLIEEATNEYPNIDGSEVEKSLDPGEVLNDVEEFFRDQQDRS